jgi:hypothetical protein
MRRVNVIVVFAAWFAVSAATAAAQPCPPYCHHYGYYGYDYNSALVIYDLTRAGGGRRRMAQCERLLGQRVAAQQMAATQSDIRNAIEADGQWRMQGIAGQQQANHEWWLQTQQQQVSQRQTQAAQLALLKAAADLSPAAPAGSELIQWPSALRGSRFADQRARIEAPYHRGSRVPIAPTARDYEEMIIIAGQMKTILKAMGNNVSAQGYRDAEAFLDQLAAEARRNLDNARPGKTVR